MTDVNQTNTTDVGQQQADAETGNQDVSTIESEVSRLNEELAKANKNLEAARRGEKNAKSQKEQIEQTIRAEYEQKLNEVTKELNSFKQKEFESNLTAKLNEAGAVEPKALIKIIGNVEVDKISEAIEQAKNEFPNLFAKQPVQQVNPPTLQKGSEGVDKTSMQTELRQALDKHDINAVRAIYQKYGVQIQ